MSKTKQNKRVEAAGLGIAAVERETGLSKDVLRVWERRYGFPVPVRDALGERSYPAEQLARLKLVRRLMDMGMRPGRLLALDLTALTELLAAHCPAPGGDAEQTRAALALLREHRGDELQAVFRQAIVRNGLSRFVTEIAVPLTAQVGEAWMRGEIEVHEEHLFTEQLTGALRAAMPATGSGARPRVLLTTVPGEPHTLGLLMAEATLRLEGAACVSLGVQTPLTDVAAACAAHAAQVVALSFSLNFPAAAAAEALAALRGQLPAAVALWCGGAGAGRLRKLPPGVRVITRLEDVGLALADWRAGQGEPAAAMLS